MVGKLMDEIKKKAPIVVGLDPQMGFIPPEILKEAFAEYGESLEGAGEAIFRFNKINTIFFKFISEYFFISFNFFCNYIILKIHNFFFYNIYIFSMLRIAIFKYIIFFLR